MGMSTVLARTPCQALPGLVGCVVLVLRCTVLPLAAGVLRKQSFSSCTAVGFQPQQWCQVTITLQPAPPTGLAVWHHPSQLMCVPFSPPSAESTAISIGAGSGT